MCCNTRKPREGARGSSARPGPKYQTTSLSFIQPQHAARRSREAHSLHNHAAATSRGRSGPPSGGPPPVAQQLGRRYARRRICCQCLLLLHVSRRARHHHRSRRAAVSQRARAGKGEGRRRFKAMTREAQDTAVTIGNWVSNNVIVTNTTCHLFHETGMLRWHAGVSFLIMQRRPRMHVR